MHYYTAYGLSLASEQLIPGFVALPGGAAADVRVELGRLPDWVAPDALARSEPRYVSSYLDANGTPSQRIWKAARGYFLLLYTDGIAFVVDRAGQEIWGSWAPGLSLDHAALYLRGAVMSFVLGLRGFICLHASAVVIDGRAVGFAGSAGAGKSTTAAAFVRRGFPALSDDILAVSANATGLAVLPGYPQLCVWPDSAVVGPWVEALPRVVPDEDKRYVRLGADPGCFHADPADLGAIYILNPGAAGSCEPSVEELRGTEGFVSLVANNCGSGRLNRRHRAAEFAVLGRVANEVPVRRVHAPRDPGSLGELCDLILRDFRASLEKN